MGRDITQLHPELQEKLSQLLKLCESKGIHIKIGECYRTVAEQNELYEQGRTKPGNIVTNAPGSSYSSQHQWMIAADFYLCMDIDGDGSVSDDAFNNSSGMFDKVGVLAESVGLGWGGRWKSPVDRPHLYLPNWGSTTTQLKTLYGTPVAFKKTWETSQGTNTTPSTTKPQQTAIRDIQTWINWYSTANIKVDGYTGPETRKGLLKCLQSYINVNCGGNLAVDGIWGPRTESACPVASGKGTLVKILQSILYCRGYDPGTIDGYDGPNTRAAVKEFQKYNGLAVDGVAGRNTFKKLFK